MAPSSSGSMAKLGEPAINKPQILLIVLR